MNSRERSLLKKSLAYGRHSEILDERGKKEKGRMEGRGKERGSMGRKGPLKT